MGPPKFFDVSLPACHGLRTPADLPILAIHGCFVLPSGTLKPSASATSHFEAVPALQGTRFPLRPTGFSVYASPILFGHFPARLRHGRKTRYGWVASPYPTGTFTLQETPSFSWRCNDLRERAPAQDRDGDALSYRLVEGPTGATLDALTGELRFAPTAPGRYRFVLKALDGKGGIAAQDFAVEGAARRARAEGARQRTTAPTTSPLPSRTASPKSPSTATPAPTPPWTGCTRRGCRAMTT